MSRAELILYATPVGPLSEALDAVFAELARTAPTNAQTYPPHVTLTGFFHRQPDDVNRIVDEVAASAAGHTTDVEIVALRSTGSWTGLELHSPELEQRAQRFADRHVLRNGDDPIRLKDWLHLSVAYGDGDLALAAPIAQRIDTTLAVDWQVALWQRLPDGRWQALSPA